MSKCTQDFAQGGEGFSGKATHQHWPRQQEGADAPSCSTSCERTKPPPAPRPASIPHFMGQFGEPIQMDVVYVRDLSGTNHPLLGIADLATSLRQAVRLYSRASAHVVDQLRKCRLMPYGYRLVCEVDADGAFEGGFRLHMEEAGVDLVVIPPEAQC